MVWIVVGLIVLIIIAIRLLSNMRMIIISTVRGRGFERGMLGKTGAVGWFRRKLRSLCQLVLLSSAVLHNFVSLL